MVKDCELIFCGNGFILVKLVVTRFQYEVPKNKTWSSFLV